METIGKRYRIKSKIGAGAMGAVYHAEDRLTGQSVALKQVQYTPDPLAATQLFTEDPSTSLRLAITNEFQTLASLRHPHVINVMDYGFDEDNLPFFTMTMLEGSLPFTQGAFGKGINKKVRMLVEVLQALDYLHRRSILHRDLKPDNALVNPDNTVTVLDFGLAIFQEQFDADSESVSGTLAYIAPELIQGQPPSPQSDLYALGMMAFEIFAGHYPFETANVSMLIQQIIMETPDVDAMDVSYGLASTVMKLLEKDPDERFASAKEAIHALLESSETRINLETEEIRESYLQTAPFLGRESELEQLTAMLEQAKAGQGAFWLVGGETGVGKTRLLEELRTLALVRGMLVLRGQGVGDTGGLPYQLWREPVRRLLLAADVDDLDAAILRDIVPDIEQVLGRPIPSVIDLQGPDYQQRLITSIVNLFRKYPYPALLVLEDLQWADESLKVLSALAETVSDLPMFVIGSYRQEERPDLPDQFPDNELISLNRLSEEAVAQISVSMLGEWGQRNDVLQLLHSQSEGNIYFMIEVIRVLAEEAGNLEQIEQMSLPAQVAAVSIQDVMMRRLNRVPNTALDLLKTAALQGRELDLSVLRNAAPNVELDEWLAACTNCAVVEVVDEVWHFSHDKLRETLISTVVVDDRAQRHAQIASAIEKTYPNSPEQAGILAMHWGQAHNTAKELFYQQQAGEYALRISSLAEAVGHFRRVLDLLSAEAPDTRIDTLIRLGESEKYLGNYAEAADTVQQALTLATEIGDEIRIASAEYEFADVLLQQDDYQDALDHANKGLSAYRQREHQQGIARSLSNIGLIYTKLGDYNKAVELCEESLRLSEQLDEVPVTIKTVTRLGVATYLLGEWDNAYRYFNRGLELSQANHERRWIANAHLNLGSVAVMQGDNDTSRNHYQSCLAIVQEIGDRRLEALALDNLGYVAMRSDDLDSAQQYMQQSLPLLEKLGNKGGVANTYVNMGQVAYKQHNYSQATAYYLESIQQSLSIDAKPIILESLVGLAQVADDPATAARYVGLALTHESTTGETQEMAKELVESLKAQMSDNQFEAAYSAGEAADLDEIVKSILSLQR